MSWRFVSRLVVRKTGFALEPLLDLAFRESARAIDALLDCEEALTLAKKELLASFNDAVTRSREANDEGGLRFLSKMRRKVAADRVTDEELVRLGERVPVDAFARARRERNGARAEAERVFAKELTDKRRALRDAFRDPWMKEAVWVSNPDAFENGFDAFLRDDLTQRKTKAKALERRYVTYLQRFCAKNDTASFFGPMNYGVLDGAHAEPVRFSQTAGKMRERRVYFSFWMVSALAEIIAADPEVRPLLVPRLHPLWRLTDQGIESLDGANRIALSSETRAVLRSLDGRALGALPARTVIEVLAKKGIVDLSIAIPSTIFDPFGWLEEFVARAPSRWTGALASLRALLEQTANASLGRKQELTHALEERFTALTGKPARRLSGKTYADRTLFYEECDGTIQELSFNRSFTEDLKERLALVLELAGSYGQVLQRHYQRLARRALEGKRTLPYGAFIKAVSSLSVDDGDCELTRFEQKLRALIDPKKSVVYLDRAALAPLLNDDPTLGLHTSPDLMFAAKDRAALARGDYELVLGEVHQFLAMWGSQLLFDRERSGVARETEALLAQLPNYEGLATILNTRRHKGLLHESFPGTFLQLFGHSARDGQRVEPLRDLEVVDDGETLALRSKRTGQRFSIYNSGDEKLHLWAFAVPRVTTPAIELPGHTPRIEVGGVVFQRERWDVTPNITAENEIEGFIALRRLKRQHALPRFCFFRVASEKKPLFLDFDNYLLGEVLLAELVDNATVTFSEMLPGPEELWLENEDGRFCVEMRGTAFRVPVARAQREVA